MPSIAQTRRMIKAATKRIPEKFPDKGEIVVIDGNLADVRVDKSPTLLKNCKIIGDPTMIVVGQTVSLKWENNPGGTKSPVVLASGAGAGATGAGVTVPVAVVDDITIENSGIGLRVKAGGIGLKHLDFTPAMKGHKHDDSFSGSGWKVTSDGIIVSGSGQTRLHPDGMIALGTQPDILKLSSGNATYRMWVGNNSPASAPFSVSKTGAIKATSGEIASWNLSTDRIYADSGMANIVAGTDPWIGLGTMTEFGEALTEGIWMGRDPADQIYKLYVGKPDGDHMYWDGDVLYITGVYEGVLNVEETWADTFTINADLSDVTSKLILARPGAINAEISWSGASVGINRKTQITGGFTASDDMEIDGDTLLVDVDEDKVYINSGTLPTYRGALTVKPAINTDKGLVIQGLSGQSGNLLTVYNSSDAIVWRAASNGDLESGNYFSGVTGWTVEGTGDAEFGNITARGEIRASVFSYGDIHATAGTLGVFKSGSKLYADWTSPLPAGSNTMDVDEDQNGVRLFSTGDFLRIKALTSGGALDVWVEVTGYTDHSGYTTYNVIHKSGNASTVFRKGTAVVDYGPSGSGWITLSADGTVGAVPNMSMGTHAGAPWTTLSTNVRVGNLNGVLSISSDEYGIAFGKDLSDTTQAYGVFTNAQANLVGVAQTWKNTAGTIMAQVDPDATGTESLFWLGVGPANKRLDFSSSGLLALRTGVVLGNFASTSVTMNGGLVWAPLDGGPYSNNYWIDFRNQANLQGAAAWGTSVFGMGAKYNKGAAIGSTATNYITNPKFYTNITDGWAAAVGTGTVTRDTTTYYISPASCKIVAGTTDSYMQSDGASLSVPNGSTVYAQARVRRVGSGTGVRVQIRDTTNAATRANAVSSVENSYELLVASWTNNTGSAAVCQVRLDNNSNDSTTYANFDCVQIELDRPTTFFYGGINGAYTWGTGGAHLDTSTRGTTGYIKYVASMPSNWTVSCWLTPTLMPNETGSNTRVWEWYYDANNRVVLYMDTVNDILRVTWVGNGTQKYTSIGTAVLTRGEPNHLVVTYDGTTCTLWVNGVSDGTLSDETAMATSPNYIYVGCDPVPTNNLAVNGVIDDFIVLNTALPEETIVKLNAASAAANVIYNTEFHLYEPGYGRIRMISDGVYVSDDEGNAILGVSTGNLAPSWGGFTLAAGDIVLGHNQAGSSAILWDQSAGTFGFYGNAGASPQVIIDTDGSITAAAGKVKLNANGIEAYSGANKTVAIDTDGDAFFGSNLAAAATTALAIFANAQTYNSESMGAADILFGDNSSNKANILWDKSAGQLKFRGGTTIQAYIDTDGAVKAGGGNILLNADGLTLSAPTAYDSTASIKFMQGTTKHFEIYTSSQVGGTTTTYLSQSGVPSLSHVLRLQAYAGSGYGATLELRAREAATSVGLDIFKDATSSYGEFDTDEVRFSACDVGIGQGLKVGGTTSLNVGTGVIVATTDIYTTTWTDYSGSSTVTGWAATPTVLLRYKRVGKLVFVNFNINGTSNNTATSFTLPYTCNAQVGAWFPFMGQDNASWGFRGGRLSANTSTVNLYSNAGTGAWTNTGTKQVIGEFFYQTT